jgi:hypothetical protein
MCSLLINLSRTGSSDFLFLREAHINALHPTVLWPQEEYQPDHKEYQGANKSRTVSAFQARREAQRRTRAAS